jgi:Major capsid protein Gp23
MLTSQELLAKWKPVLEEETSSPITDLHRRVITAQILENTERELSKAGEIGGQYLTESGITTSSVSNFDPILISLVRRAMPNLIAYDICGVQPMTGPTGLIFAMRSQYANSSNNKVAETFYNEVNTAFSTLTSGANTLGQKMVGTYPGNTTTGTANLAEAGIYNFGSGMATANAESIGNGTAFPEMSFTIDKVTVTAKSRALKAEYTMELAQDLKAIHGLDAETELSNILTTEVLAEINREVVRTVNVTAVQGSTSGTTTSGRFDLDTDSNGRWSVEKFKGLMFHLERECNQIAKDTRRGKGNMMICSSDVASALQMAGVLDYTPALNSNNLVVDDTGATFAGVLNGRLRVYIDPYAGGNYATVGYKGPNPFDAGLFYCPYVPLQMVRAVNTDTFQPKIGFKTRYGMAPNPFAKGLTAADASATLEKDSNVYYRRTLIDNIL